MAEHDVPRVRRLGDIYLLDTLHMGLAGTIGVFLIPGPGGSFALIESGPTVCLETLEAAIREAGFDPAALAEVLVTHIHLDHAGAAGVLADKYHAMVYVHEAGYAHLRDPSRLLASAKRLYGEQMDTLWGAMLAIPDARLQSVEEGDSISVAGRRVDVLYTPGHASHHVAYLLDRDTLFTGDAAAIKLPGSSLIRPAVPPPEVDLEAWNRSLEHMREVEPSRLLLTHFGEVTDVDNHLNAVRDRTHAWAELILVGLNEGLGDEALLERLSEVVTAELEADHATPAAKERHRVTSSNAMTVAGLKRYWQKRHPERLPNA